MPFAPKVEGEGKTSSPVGGATSVSPVGGTLQIWARRSTLFPEFINMEWPMPINVNNPEADALTRKFAHIAGVSITDAIVIAMKEAIERRRHQETPLQTAARLREQYGVKLDAAARQPLPREAYDELWES